MVHATDLYELWLLKMIFLLFWIVQISFDPLNLLWQTVLLNIWKSIQIKIVLRISFSILMISLDTLNMLEIPDHILFCLMLSVQNQQNIKCIIPLDDSLVKLRFIYTSV